MTLGISGHQELSAEVEAFVKARLLAELQSLPEALCVSSLAVGADQLFAQTALACATPLHVVVPCQHYEETFPSPQALAQYQRLRAQASSAETLDYDRPGTAAFLAAGQRVADLSDKLVAIWDGKPARGEGGTADIVAYAQQLGKPVLVLWPSAAPQH
ncbi:MAG TPA: hypothetical protein VF629_07860 [Hymenobacter sp.]|jgi:hypothetical protein|uniref:hypothetical protein n=1 Tax=Hymenobacter sp. TaxID=1898978 RepID=UPI002EDB5D9D